MILSRTSRWRIAFARQAIADLNARDALLRIGTVPACQQLHFLQMACEKVSKAFLCWRGADPDSLQTSHAYLSTALPQIVKQQLLRATQRPSAWVVVATRQLARQIELLAPSVDEGGAHPANCEYPWEDARGEVHIPAEHNFAMDLLHTAAGVHLLKAVRIAARELST